MVNLAHQPQLCSSATSRSSQWQSKAVECSRASSNTFKSTRKQSKAVESTRRQSKAVESSRSYEGAVADIAPACVPRVDEVVGSFARIVLRVPPRALSEACALLSAGARRHGAVSVLCHCVRLIRGRFLRALKGACDVRLLLQSEAVGDSVVSSDDVVVGSASVHGLASVAGSAGSKHQGKGCTAVGKVVSRGVRNSGMRWI
eukprot:4724086-Pleurochrysis_carterae.AAC.1